MSRRVLLRQLPGGLLFAAAAIVPRVPALRGSIAGFLPVVFVLVFGGGFLLGWRFDRSRVALALLVLALADRALPRGGPETLAAVAVLLPLNLAALAWLPERGLLTPRGWIKLAALGAQALAVAGLFRPRIAAAAAPWLDHVLVRWAPLAALPLPQPALAAGLLAAGLVVARLALRPTALESGSFWSLAAAELALLCGPAEPGLTLALTAAGLILVVSLVETSRGMAFDDDLTGLPGRRALNEELLKLGDRYAIAMVDIDHFKRFNDEHGHDVGDQLLRMVGAKLGDIEGGGQAFRYGGEEFAVLFPGKVKSEAAPFLESLRAGLADSAFVVRSRRRPRRKPEPPLPAGSDKKVWVTVSIGVASPGDESATPEEVLKAADVALYRAKKTGRNRLCS